MTHGCVGPGTATEGVFVAAMTHGSVRQGAATEGIFAPPMRWLIMAALAALAACTQSEQVFEPTNNRAVTATTTAATYTFTLNINITTHAANHQNQPFSALLFRDGTLYAAQYNNGATAGTDMTSGTGTATLVLNGVDTNGCPTATPAALEAGTYTLYFAIQYGAETVTTVNPNGACVGGGWIESSSAGNNLYGVKAVINVTGNTSYNVLNTNLAQFRQNTFEFTSNQWRTGKQYYVGAFVYDAGTVYRVIADHTSAAAIGTDIGPRLQIISAFANNTLYASGTFAYEASLKKVFRVISTYTSTASAQDDVNNGFLIEVVSINLPFAQYACYVGDINATTYAATMQPLAIYNRAADGTTTGGTAAVNLLPVGTYKYFCSGGGNTTHFESGDSQATGTFTVTHTGVTNLSAAAFSVIP